MKKLVTLIFLMYSLSIFSQQTETIKSQHSDTSNMVTFTTKFEMAKMATKDGFMMEGYIVNISYEQAKSLNGKKIKISGKYTIVKGLQNEPKEYDENGNILHKQGRLNDVKLINLPIIEILE